MIDWPWVGSNTLWILGLALLLATGSYHSYRASQRRAPARPGSAQLNTGLSFRLGLLLVCLGLCATSGHWLERGLWAVISLGVVIEIAVSRRRTTPKDGEESGDCDVLWE